MRISDGSADVCSSDLLRRILEAEADFEVVGEAGSAAEAVEVALSAQPDVFVMDLGLPDRNGIAATADVCSVSPGTRVLVLTVHDDVAYLRRAFDAGRSEEHTSETPVPNAHLVC